LLPRRIRGRIFLDPWDAVLTKFERNGCRGGPTQRIERLAGLTLADFPGSNRSSLGNVDE
jgi:hypothetical protein